MVREDRIRTANGKRALPKLFFLFAYVLAIAVLPAAAKTHPVPLDKNVDSAKCLECHEDKSKGKAVHSAIATGCLSCHEVRVNKDVTRIKLTTTVPYKLCLTCHADKDAAQTQGHDPQASGSRLPHLPRPAYFR